MAGMALSFSVNPNASRYDALVSNSGALENANWDGIWEAKTYYKQ